uniref:Uncharacterized protein n=1 Tax=Vespula pensylvanica TaxID=30213 RepID=A0A834UED7_VESPE|nr:hypothetical protein H0235_002658 [Vespula pensylvanica]
MLPQTPDIIPTTLNQVTPWCQTNVLLFINESMVFNANKEYFYNAKEYLKRWQRDLGERKGLWTVNRASTLRSMLNHRQASSRRLVDAHETASAFL